MEEVLWEIILSKTYRFEDWICSSYQLLDNAATVRAIEPLRYLTR